MLYIYADINECLLRNGHGPCQDQCHNLYGTYRCSCDSLPGTMLTANGSCVDAGDCALNNGGCSQKCLTTEYGRKFCLCDAGFVIDTDDFKTCKGIYVKR